MSPGGLTKWPQNSPSNMRTMHSHAKLSNIPSSYHAVLLLGPQNHGWLPLYQTNVQKIYVATLVSWGSQMYLKKLTPPPGPAHCNTPKKKCHCQGCTRRSRGLSMPHLTSGLVHRLPPNQSQSGESYEGNIWEANSQGNRGLGDRH